MSKLCHFLSFSVGVVVVYIPNSLNYCQFQSQVVAETSEIVCLGLTVALLHVVQLSVEEDQLYTGSSELCLGSLEGGVLGGEDIVGIVFLLHVDSGRMKSSWFWTMCCLTAMLRVLNIL